MVVKFNTTMVTDFYNISILNETFIDIYVEPALNRHVDSEDFKMESVNLTWKAVYYKFDEMWFELKFNQPSAISPLKV